MKRKNTLLRKFLHLCLIIGSARESHTATAIELLFFFCILFIFIVS